MKGNTMSTTQEPAVLIATIMAVVQAALGLLVGFGLDLSADQVAAVMTFSGAVLALIAGVVIRGQVTPTRAP
jgi:hypothetical protein